MEKNDIYLFVNDISLDEPPLGTSSHQYQEYKICILGIEWSFKYRE